jgi:hypothetical protein
MFPPEFVLMQAEAAEVEEEDAAADPFAILSDEL